MLGTRVTVLLIVTALSTVSIIVTTQWLQTKNANAKFPQKISDKCNLHKQQYATISTLRIPYNDQKTYSKFRCVGDMNNVDGWTTRACVWHDICYDSKTEKYLYYGRKKSPILFDKKQGHIYSFRYRDNGFVALNRWLFGLTKFAPSIIENSSMPTTDMHYLDSVHVIWQRSDIGSNFGHIVFEDFLSIFQNLVRLGLDPTMSILMHKDVLPSDKKFINLEKTFRPAITMNPSVSMKPYLKQFGKRYICFKNLQAGSPVTTFDPIADQYNTGKEEIFYTFRNNLLKVNGLDPNYLPKKHKIVITKKVGSDIPNYSGERRTIANLDEIEKFLRAEYPLIDVEVVQWNKLSLIEQMKKCQETTILITPCGGVSFMIPFLPNGAHAIVMDYYSGTQNEDWRGIGKDESVSMEGAFWNHLPHIKPLYYQVREKDKDWMWAWEGATNYRHDIRIIVNTRRLKELVESALDHMA